MAEVDSGMAGTGSVVVGGFSVGVAADGRELGQGVESEGVDEGSGLEISGELFVCEISGRSGQVLALWPVFRQMEHFLFMV